MAVVRLKALNRIRLRAWFPHARELAIIAGAYWLYMYTRSLAFNDLGATALANASVIISVERSLGFFWEPQWQEWAISGAKALVVFFNWAYIVTFWPIILTTGSILYVVNRNRYRYYRNIVLITLALALVAFAVFPLAPPRMMAEHFVDTINAFGPRFYASREFANFYNPYAAMPSLHFSWTIMFGVLFLRTPNKLLKIFGVLYPTLTLLAITITANHYIMDAGGGGLLMIAAFVIVELGFRRRFFLPKMHVRLRPSLNRRRSPAIRVGRANTRIAGEGSQATCDDASYDPGKGDAPASNYGNPSRQS
jgi:hypothetical protein